MQLLAAIQLAMLARRHLQALTPGERRRLVDLVRRGHRLSRPEREELRMLAGKLDLREFATGAAARLSPVRVPGMGGRRRRR
jgi:ABC-type hemin transport system ATPase subunit